MQRYATRRRWSGKENKEKRTQACGGGAAWALRLARALAAARSLGVVLVLASVLAVAGVCAAGAAAAQGQVQTQGRAKVTITFWNWWDQQRKDLMDEVIRRFEAEYPWIDVKNEVQGWSGREAKVMAAYAAGAPPELMMVTRSELAALSDLGAIIPISDFVQRDQLDLKMFFSAEIQAFLWEGELWSLPLPSVSGEESMYFFNKALFEESGLDPAHPPITWKTFTSALQKLTRLDGQGRITQLGMETNSRQVINYTYVNGGQIISDDRRRAVFASDRALEALRFVASDMTQKALHGYTAMNAFRGGASAAQRFVDGRDAIIGGNPSVIGFLLTNAPKGFEWGVMPLPYNDARRDSQSRGVAGLQWGWGYVIPKGLPTDKQEAAWLFLKFLTTDERGGGYFMLEQGRPSPVARFNLNPEYTRKIGANWPLIIKYIANDVAFPVIPVQQEIFTTVSNGLGPALQGKSDPEGTLKTINDQLQTILDKYWAKRK